MRPITHQSNNRQEKSIASEDNTKMEGEEPGSSPIIVAQSLGVTDHKKNEHPLQQAILGVEKHPMNLDGVEVYCTGWSSQTGVHESNGYLGKRKRDVPVHNVVNLVEPELTSNLSAQSVVESTFQAATLHPAAMPLLSNGYGTSLNGIQSTAVPLLPTFVNAENRGSKHRVTVPAMMGSSSYNGTNTNTSSPFANPRFYHSSPPFSRPNRSGMPPNGVLRAPAPHLAAFSKSATTMNKHQPKVSGFSTAHAGLHATQGNTMNTTGFAPSHSIPHGAMVALRDLPIKLNHGGILTYDDTAIPVPGCVTGTNVGVPFADPDTNAFAAAPPPPMPYSMINTRGPQSLKPDEPIHVSDLNHSSHGFRLEDAFNNFVSSSTQEYRHYKMAAIKGSKMKTHS
ncbi:hypothetical protein ACP4OV_015126 [Aristida adscensionis]